MMGAIVSSLVAPVGAAVIIMSTASYTWDNLTFASKVFGSANYDRVLASRRWLPMVGTTNFNCS